MSPYLSESALGTEELLAIIESAIIRDINDALATIYERRTAGDMARAELRGEEYVPLTYEEIAADRTSMSATSPHSYWRR